MRILNFNVNPVVLPILIGLAVLIGGTLILYNIYRLSQQPKVEIKFCYKYASSGGGAEHDTINLSWYYEMILINNTQFDALSLSIDFNKFLSKYAIDKKPRYIKALSQEVLKVSFNNLFAREVVENTKDRFNDLIPGEFNDSQIILSYSNDKNKFFYTKYIKTDNEQINTFHKIKPKIKYE
jgi:hypothetical protein